MIRAFFGIELIPEAILRLQQESAHLKQSLSNVRWIDSSLMHITVKFFGAIEASSLATISKIAEEIAHTTQAFSVTIKKIGGFPQPRTKVIAAYVAAHQELLRLHILLNEAALKMGVKPELRRYRPHITLAKFQSAPAHTEPLICTDFYIPVTELILYESRAGALGSQYIPLHRFKLIE